MTQNVENFLEQLVAGLLQIPVARVTDELAMKDLDEWDSLKHMELIGALESQLDIQLSFEEIVAMRTVGDIRRTLSKRGLET
jgi:acyl carrier protein